MFCLGGGGASQIYKLTIKLEGGGIQATLGRPGPARPGPTREGPSIRAPRGPKHYSRYYAGQGGGI